MSSANLLWSGELRLTIPWQILNGSVRFLAGNPKQCLPVIPWLGSVMARLGGVTVVLAGDPKQCLPVIPKSSPTRIVDACYSTLQDSKLVSTRLHTHLLEAIILTGEHAGQPVLLPRITLKTGSSAELPFTLHRTQFRIRLAMAMTFSKLQEQLALAQVGVCLETPVFSHGQLYVALS
ncbi:BZ3500_MvSof-1268-A1-R1_Chr8-2g10296 [Microbotryum saponariae]|uniref:ATP-dependent DNA helicase n=1 Tax=Microbotryum saponariae TaxID=289078 RepID=A0A2X0L645_9BASI|nr:BZ3500_MvSof-1268-A1-R1_Chr8-2g10296 [Microbotryum saponariae]SDA02124.1 BZ3501_MvSof-1269-A2-R1_Chr8-2g10045 [Microbotryum saponariae]